MKSIILNNKIVEYDLKHNSKKNVNIRVKSDLTLNVSAPRWVVKSELERILNQKSNWILDNIEKQRVIQKNKKTIILDNNHAIWYLGKKYRFFYRSSDKNFVVCTNEQMIVFTKRINDIEYSKKIFLDWLRSNAEEIFTNALNKYRSKMNRRGYNIPEYVLQIRSMKTRWGTCTPSKKKITLNLNLIYANEEYIEYVALHELVHFVEIYHNNHFYSVVEEFMPDYKIRQEKLNKEYSQIVKAE